MSNKSQDIKDLASALVKAQADFPKIPKDKTVTKKGVAKASGKAFEYSYNYADLNTIIELTLPVLLNNGISVSQSCSENYVFTTLIHSSGQWIESAFPMISAAPDMQTIGGNSSYARRYGWQLAVGVNSDDDLDGNDSKQDEFDIQKKAPVASQPLKNQAGTGVATEKQVNMISFQFKRLGTSPAGRSNFLNNKAINDLTVSEASNLIKKLVDIPNVPEDEPNIPF